MKALKLRFTGRARRLVLDLLEQRRFRDELDRRDSYRDRWDALYLRFHDGRAGAVSLLRAIADAASEYDDADDQDMWDRITDQVGMLAGVNPPDHDDEDDEYEEDDEDADEDIHESDVRCPVCPGPGVFLGQLGNRKHYRCRDCAAQFSVEAKKTPA